MLSKDSLRLGDPLWENSNCRLNSKSQATYSKLPSQFVNKVKLTVLNCNLFFTECLLDLCIGDLYAYTMVCVQIDALHLCETFILMPILNGKSERFGRQWRYLLVWHYLVRWQWLSKSQNFLAHINYETMILQATLECNNRQLDSK